MSLLVWLPLNGNIKNQGLLGNVQFINGTSASIVSDDNGKIGKCYTFSGTHKGIDRVGNTGIRFTDYLMDKDPNTGDLTTAKSVSLSAWVKVTSELTTYPLIYIGYVTSLEFGTTCKFRIAGGSTRVVTYSLSNYTNKWYHIAGVYNKSTQELKLYLNGECVSTKSGISNFAFNSTDTYATRSVTLGQNHNSQSSTDSTYYLQGSLNDVRIYDHALSPLEVKELAKGLICHYTLASNSLSRINKATMNITSWTNSSSAGEYIENDTSYIGMQNVVSITSAGGQRGIYLGADTPLVSGKHYLCSCMVYFHGSDSQTEFFLRKDTSTSNHKLAFLAYNGETNCSLWPRDRWIYVYCVYTADADYNVARLCTYVQTNGAKKSFTAWKIEEIGTGTAYDSSGYSNNCSVISGGQLTISSDTPRYDSCCEFNGSTRISCISPTDEAKSASVWVYIGNTIPGTNSDNGVVFADYKSKLALGFGSSGIIVKCVSSNKIDANRARINTNTWNHFCVVNNGEENILYTNGQPVTMSGSNYWGHSTDTLIVGGRNTTSAVFSGKLSDFRLYATALTAADVTDLYNMGAAVS